MSFDFRAGQTTPVFLLRNRATGSLPQSPHPFPSWTGGPVDESLARLDFLCSVTECALYRSFPANYGTGWSLHTPKFKNEMGRAIEPSELRPATVLVPVRSSD